MQQLRAISVSDLRPGLTVWREETVRGAEVYKPDVYLADYFLSDYPPREFIQGHRLQFITNGGQKVAWRNSGRVVVSVGRAKKETIRKEYVNG
jgi:hypothetical protein